MNDHYIVAVTGGIGSGKSVVCNMLSAMGYEVYDCDSRARRIMDEDSNIKAAIAKDICADAISETGDILRDKLAEIVFNDSDALVRLNKCVHSAVRNDVRRESLRHRVLFVETAILYQSEMDCMVDSVWEVVAPLSVRVSRVMNRNGISESQVMARIKAQSLPNNVQVHPRTFYITNDDTVAVLPQLLDLINDEFEFIRVHPRTEF